MNNFSTVEKSSNLLSPGHPKSCPQLWRSNSKSEQRPPFAANPRQRRGGICIVVNQLEDDGGELEATVDIDMDDEDEFVFDEEFSSTVGFENPAEETSNHTRAGLRVTEEATEQMPLIRKLFARFGRHHQSSGGNGQNGVRGSEGGRKGNKRGKKGW